MPPRFLLHHKNPKTMSMPVVTLSPSNTTSFHLDGAKETIVLKLGGPTDDREIDVFDAQKYFSEGLYQTPKLDPKIRLSSSIHDSKKDESLVAPALVPPKISTLRSTGSESSTNSQSALLHSNERNPRRWVMRKGFLASIGCNCSCVDKNSVDIDDCTDTGLVKGDLVRKSTANAVETIRHSTISKELNDDDDGGADSDGSSDLFEIESFSRGNPFLNRQGSDGGLSRSTCYAPSEASIEWSVVTASAAAASDSEEVTDRIPPKVGQSSKYGKEILKLRPGILSGCKSQKSVSVAGDAHRLSAPATIRPGLSDTRKHQTAPAENSLPTRFRVVLPQSRPSNGAHMSLY